ncbi:NYN domain-containing protein [Sphingosinicella ginsenosidimutans]|uniref:NYN domain-containing protein n=1 Tax=Allosphingosinicella ginsenosidimutans TaxID=1176539 RepID=A0A5C6TWA0_9SPHN|nr:NYN domain-containing protein [Sphingosinicella ginsenosidimutans]TXC64637.1 NYN domain-containing protein [Sphingosinicella ginsenosidimutans]
MSDEPNGRSRNVALLIDADNASPDTLDPVLTVLAELGTVNIRRAYGNWQKPALKGWAAMTHRHAIEPQQQFDVTKGKSSTDMRMVIDAMDLLYRGHIDGFGIMSSDSDFMPLAMRIRQDGVPVYGFGTAKTPESFRQACTRFIDVGALPRPEEPEGAEQAESRIDPNVVKILGEAWRNAKRDERGFASLSDVGKLAGNRSSFDARSYGYARLADMIEAIPNFQTERREGGQLFVKRVR